MAFIRYKQGSVANWLFGLSLLLVMSRWDPGALCCDPSGGLEVCERDTLFCVAVFDDDGDTCCRDRGDGTRTIGARRQQPVLSVGDGPSPGSSTYVSPAARTRTTTPPTISRIAATARSSSTLVVVMATTTTSLATPTSSHPSLATEQRGDGGGGRRRSPATGRGVGFSVGLLALMVAVLYL
ncbi:hypothetical protein VTK73DRAFT_4221 [Phialemonium thermophilum]|uniref:Uncharacterized protein n=1 Tax=Phialemonium thermophilum TaxID=223376 RepID=A0ABR3VAM6_9PEZI